MTPEATVDAGRGRPHNEIVASVKNNGPGAREELLNRPRVTPAQRTAGIGLLRLGRSQRPGETVIAFHHDAHDKEQVLATWADANAELVESTSIRELDQHISKKGASWTDAWNTVKEDVDLNDSYGASTQTDDSADADTDESDEASSGYSQDCPRCGEEDVGQLPFHLTDCPAV